MFRFADNETAQDTGTEYDVKSRFKLVRYVKFTVDHSSVPIMEATCYRPKEYADYMIETGLGTFRVVWP